MSALLATWNPARGVWETTRANLLCGHLEPFLETWPISGSMRNGRASEHPTSGPRTGGSVSSSSRGRVKLLSTPDTVPEAPNTGSNSHKAGNIVGLGNQVMSLLS